MTSDVIVSALGRLKVANNTKVHEVRLMVESGGAYTTIASIPIRMYPSTTDNSYVYQNLATPVLLESGKTYVLVSREFSGVSENYCDAYNMSGLDDAVFKNVDPDKPKACSFPWSNGTVGTRSDDSVTGRCYGGVNLKYY